MDTFKVLVVGYRKTGKSSILRSLNGHMDPDLNTCNVDFPTRDDGNLRFVCSEHSEITMTNVCAYHGIMIVFDVMQMESYRRMQTFCRILKSLGMNKPVVIVGNKSDYPNWKVKGIAADKVFDLPFVPTLSFVQGVDVPLPQPDLPAPIADNAANADEEAVQAPNADEEAAQAPIANEEVILKSPTLTCLDAMDDPNPGPVDGASDPNNIPAKAAPLPLPSNKVLNRKPTLRIRGNEGELDLEDIIRSQRRSCCYYL
ncbi:hypothetical protein C5167_044079 [Papaver somniferum]|uniref:Uncharacterized protein n=1 Tax=Papaver somniferum TaxID=3469 RepID=A0A4Y7LAG6_PAPSO|nr:hypothetical protein C5167_044079 [Papaver somniferum]